MTRTATYGLDRKEADKNAEISTILQVGSGASSRLIESRPKTIQWRKTNFIVTSGKEPSETLYSSAPTTSAFCECFGDVSPKSQVMLCEQKFSKTINEYVCKHII